ncbi:hypothetical protein Emed_003473 [Eimeria media]
MCCKLWFTVPRSNSRKLLSRLTDLLRCAVVDQREDVNAHIPHDIFRGIAGHTRDKVCIANHKAFWPHPPTLLYLFRDLKVYGGAQCMGDMVVQNSSQLHWGVNLAPGVKAESSNCAGSDFMRFCPQCSDGLYCGGTEADLLKDIFDRARKEYWARRKIRAWKKKCVCWGYHGCGCIRPRALGLAENDAQESRFCSNHVEPSEDDLNLNENAQSADRQTPEKRVTSLDASRDALGWGRAFDWKEVFERHNVNMCFDEWDNLKWLPNNDVCRPLSLHSLLEDEAFAHAEPHDKFAANKSPANGSAGSGEGKKPWEDDPDASCIRIVRSASPESLKRSNACVQVDRVVPPTLREASSLKSHASEHHVGEGGETHLTCTVQPQDMHMRILPNCLPLWGFLKKVRELTLLFVLFFSGTTCPDATSAATRAEPSSGSSTEPVGAERSTTHDYVASVEFQRMWPVFLRVSSEDRTPLSQPDKGGEVVFLGCVIEAFHMRLKTQQEVQTCLDAVAHVAGASSSHETHTSNTEITTPFNDHQGTQISDDTNKCGSASRGITAESSEQEQPVSSPLFVPQLFFESAPPLTLHGRRNSDRGNRNCEDLVGSCPAASTRNACPDSSQMNEACAGPPNKSADHPASATAATSQKALPVSPASTPQAAESSKYSTTRTVLQGDSLSCPTNGFVTNGEVASFKGSAQEGPRVLSDDPTADRAASPSAQKTASATQQAFFSSPFESSHLSPERRASPESLRTGEHLGEGASDLRSAPAHQSCESNEGNKGHYRSEQVASELSPRASSPERKKRDLKIAYSGSIKVSGVHAKFVESDRDLGKTFEAAQALPTSQSKDTPLIRFSKFRPTGRGGFCNPKHSASGLAPCRLRPADIHDSGLYTSNGLHPSVLKFQRRRCLPGFRQAPHARDYHFYREGGDMAPTFRAPSQKSRPWLPQRGHSSMRACLRARPGARASSPECLAAQTLAPGNAEPAVTATTEPGEANDHASRDFSKTLCMPQECSSQLSDKAWLIGGELLSRDKTQMGIEYSRYLKGRLEAIIGRVWCWRSTFVTDFTALYHEKPFSTNVIQEAMKNGFVPYILMHYASTTCSEASLQAFDMSIGSRRNIPFHGFSESLVDSFCSGIGHGMMYYSAIPGSVFPLHCEQGGLGAFNIIVGAVAAYTEQLQPGSVNPKS